MALDRTKQGYVMLKAFERAEDETLGFVELLQGMKDLSREIFGTEEFATSPRPLMTVIKESRECGSIRFVPEGYRLTDEGRWAMRYLESNYIKPAVAA